MTGYKLVKFDEEGEFPLMAIDPSGAVAADYLSFIEGVIEALLHETDFLEKEANASGRTIKHAFFGGLGSAVLAPESTEPH